LAPITLRFNHLALGAHVANAGYVVAEHCRRQGIGSRLCQHSLQAARRLGYVDALVMVQALVEGPE
jgi:GNAT superfamily N-acetyltransferase